MRTVRTLETRPLGYSIERVDELDHLGTLRATWYEVLCPDDGSVIASSSSRSEAERIVIRRELTSAQRAVVMNRDLHVA